MKISDAKKILIGDVRAISFFGGYQIMLYRPVKPRYGTRTISLNQRDMQFALRQLALKTERERKKMNEREK